MYSVTDLISNSDTFLLTAPLVVAMVLAVFRVDELFSHSTKGRRPTGHPLSDWDESGSPICIEPDGHYRGQRKATSRYSQPSVAFEGEGSGRGSMCDSKAGAQAKRPRRNSRVVVEWVRD